MKNIGKTFATLSLTALALAFAGCSSYTEIARWKSNIPVNDGEVPLASFVTQNFSYRLLWVIPLSTGLPWTEGNQEIVDDFNIRLFADEATIDNNLATLKHALDVVGSHRITHLKTTEDNSLAWSLFLVNRHEVRTQCMILKPRTDEEK